MITVSISAAMTEEGVIGKGNVMPWKIPEEMTYFRRKTTGYPVIMGRKTHESIGRILPGRQNIVISRNPKMKKLEQPTNGLIVVDSLAAAVDWCDGQKPECFIIGGAQIYKQALDDDIVDRMYLNAIKFPYKGDVFFPEFDSNMWAIDFPPEEYAEFKPMILYRKRPQEPAI